MDIGLVYCLIAIFFAITIAGESWIVYEATRDQVTQGILCALVPFYLFYYVFGKTNHPERWLMIVFALVILAWLIPLLVVLFVEGPNGKPLFDAISLFFYGMAAVYLGARLAALVAGLVSSSLARG